MQEEYRQHVKPCTLLHARAGLAMRLAEAGAGCLAVVQPLPPASRPLLSGAALGPATARRLAACRSLAGLLARPAPPAGPAEAIARRCLMSSSRRSTSGRAPASPAMAVAAPSAK